MPPGQGWNGCASALLQEYHRQGATRLFAGGRPGIWPMAGIGNAKARPGVCPGRGRARVASRIHAHGSTAMNAQAKDATAATLDDPRWAAVVARDRQADGCFVYSVATTGVYCRPSCGARRPRPENVRFHATAREAEEAGFRPCRRCRPGEPPLARRQAALVAELCRRIDAAEAPPGLDDLARQAGMSPSHLHRLFKAVTGLTPRAYAAARRAARVRAGLQESGTVTEALYAAGYNSQARFYAEAGQVLGMRPGAYRAGGAGEAIRFAVGECSLGALLVAATSRGVCAILLGDAPEPLIRDLQARFPKADLTGGDAGFEQWVARVATGQIGLGEA